MNIDSKQKKCLASELTCNTEREWGILRFVGSLNKIAMDDLYNAKAWGHQGTSCENAQEKVQEEQARGEKALSWEHAWNVWEIPRCPFFPVTVVSVA